MIKVIVAGSRNYADFEKVEYELMMYFKANKLHRADVEIVSGTARGGTSMTSLVGKIFFLIVMVGIVFVAQNLPTILDNGEPVNDDVAYNDLEPDTEYVVSSEVVTETPTEQATESVTEAQAVTEEPVTEAPAPAMSDKEFNDKWSYAVKHEYEFYYMSSNGNSVKRNPAYIDSSLYRVEFDDTNHIVRLYDK